MSGKKKILLVFGTRPEAIKMCPLALALKNTPEFETYVCTTGQHREMLEQVLEIFKVVPDAQLDIMQEKQTLTDISARVLVGLEPYLRELQPDAVLVHGDTTTAAIAALAAFYQKVPVGHVEAGLRSGNRYSPYPEEMNRRLISRLAQWHFAPTERNAQALAAEGIQNGVFVTGNTVIDAFAYTVHDNYCFDCKELNKLDFSKKVILLTAHRRENIGEGIEQICKSVLALCDAHEDVQFVYPVHPNPAVSNPVRAKLGNCPQILLTEPLSVSDLHNLLPRCYMVMTDSGGLQEEAPHFGKPVLVLRTETERPEAIAAGTALLAGVEANKIFKKADKLIVDDEMYRKMSSAANPYGDGKACGWIIKALKNEMFRGVV